VFVETDVRALDPISRGVRDRSDAIVDGSVRLYGEPDLVVVLLDLVDVDAAHLR
jgi:hypothetical protein